MMAQLFGQDGWLVLVALLLGLIVVWWLFALGARTRVATTRRPDALDEGAAPATRNQALIDAPPAAALPIELPPATPEGLAGIGEAVGAGALINEHQHHLAGHHADDLLLIKGVGPKLNTLLQSLGVTSFAAIAAWSEEDIDRIDAQLGNFAGRIRRDSWIEQARYLAAGDMAGFEAQFGKL